MFIKMNNGSPLIHIYKYQFKKYNKILKVKSLVRCYCNSAEKVQCENFKTFEDFINLRRSEAKRSFVVQVFSEQSCWDLYDYCNSIAPIKFMQHYKSSNNEHFVLGELDNSDINPFLDECRNSEESEVLPVKSPFLWFKNSQDHKKKTSNRSDPFPTQSPVSETELFEKITQTNNLSDQMKIVFEFNRLDELGTRLRFITARQVELALSGLFPDCSVLPFGSSVNGFGKVGCDLDLGMSYSTSPDNRRSRLMFQCKEGSVAARAQMQRQMEIVADLIHVYLPGCSHVRRILRARVPIVKYFHDFTSLECDLSMTNLSGVYMSEMLWIYGTIDERVRPLVFSIRRWAQSVGLTSPIPGKNITNFSLTALVIFYLQTMQVLPSFSHLIKLARPQDARFAGDVNCTFVRDTSRIKVHKGHDDNGALLAGLFEYYSSFDYERFGICLRSGKPIIKPDHSPLYIVNPLEPTLNVSRNISSEELVRLKIECRNASWLLQTSPSLLNLFKPVHLNPQKNVSKAGKRMVSMKQLFKSQSVR